MAPANISDELVALGKAQFSVLQQQQQCTGDDLVGSYSSCVELEAPQCPAAAEGNNGAAAMVVGLGFLVLRVLRLRGEKGRLEAEAKVVLTEASKTISPQLVLRSHARSMRIVVRWRWLVTWVLVRIGNSQ